MLMTRQKNEKLLSADVNSDLADLFLEQADKRGYKKKRAFSAAIKLWSELPQEAQGRLIDQSLDANSFVALVQEIVDERIAKGYANVDKFLAKHRKSKRTRKD